MLRILAVSIVAGIVWLASTAPLAQEVRIAHLYSKAGPLEAYDKQTATGFLIGLDYATKGTMMVTGKKIVVIEKDDLGKSLLAAAYADDKAFKDALKKAKIVHEEYLPTSTTDLNSPPAPSDSLRATPSRVELTGLLLAGRIGLH